MLDDVISGIIKNKTANDKGYYYIQYKKNTSYQYTITYRDDLGILIFHAIQGDFYTGMDFSLTMGASSISYAYISSTTTGAFYDAKADISMKDYTLGDELVFSVGNKFLISSLSDSLLQSNGKDAVKDAMENWNELLKAKTGYSMKDIGFVSFVGKYSTPVSDPKVNPFVKTIFLKN